MSGCLKIARVWLTLNDSTLGAACLAIENQPVLMRKLPSQAPAVVSGLKPRNQEGAIQNWYDPLHRHNFIVYYTVIIEYIPGIFAAAEV